MKPQLSYLYLLSPLHTGGATQEGNQVGIARETHTDFPYLPSSTLRGRFRAETDDSKCPSLWGHTLEDVQQGRSENLTQGSLWIGDATLLFFPVSSLSHGVVWITCPLWIRRWLRLKDSSSLSPELASGLFSHGKHTKLYLRDAIFQPGELTKWDQWEQYLPKGHHDIDAIKTVLVVSDQDCKVLVQTSLWRQVRVNLGENKTLADNAGFRYEEAIPPETVLFFPWGTTSTAEDPSLSKASMNALVGQKGTWQFGGQESLGRGFVSLWIESQGE